ncbi:hypothetical protein [Myroides sp. DF42-4-2]|uniref:hypothetical protein n=1 Tax=Myroides sp. DF42-4-2 TaxID=2746726 RepID=UPI0025782636|nr:hypothetical protein [Myroides sp. DF42-4-2]MDM1409093.1 hypothetical protein [Myroides sp. DF42-4-2]
MNATPTHPLLPANDLYILALLQSLFDQQASFTAYAQCINELFYYYVQQCTTQADVFFLNPADVHCILEVVTVFQQLKVPISNDLEEL